MQDGFIPVVSRKQKKNHGKKIPGKNHIQEK
jgi:hypothetical protein